MNIYFKYFNFTCENLVFITLNYITHNQNKNLFAKLIILSIKTPLKIKKVYDSEMRKQMTPKSNK